MQLCKHPVCTVQPKLLLFQVPVYFYFFKVLSQIIQPNNSRSSISILVINIFAVATNGNKLCQTCLRLFLQYSLSFFRSLYFSCSLLYLNTQKSLVLKQILKYWKDQWFEMMLATKAQYVYDLCFCLAIRIVIGFNRRTTLIQTFGSYLYIFENSFSLKTYQKLGHIKLNV